MHNSADYKQFVAQFTRPEWKLLSGHRLFLHFLDRNLRRAACIAADALDRPVTYLFPSNGDAATMAPEKKKAAKKPAAAKDAKTVWAKRGQF